MKSKSRKNQARSAETREAIYEAALGLFRKKGFDSATMRDIANEAGTALGGAYYHFRSKEDVVLEFYRRTASDDLAIRAYFETDRSLKNRIIFLTEYRIGQFSPYRKFLWVLARSAVTPGHPLSPFSHESRDIREQSIELFRDALRDADNGGPLKDQLPFLLWLYHLGIILFWVLDPHPGKNRTDRLLRVTSDVLTALIRASDLPLLRGAAKKIADLLKELQA